VIRHGRRSLQGRQAGVALSGHQGGGERVLGVRKRTDHESVKITPVQYIIVGLIGAALFVLTLLLVVRFVLSQAGAGA
jgi:hypothetical protein